MRDTADTAKCPAHAPADDPHVLGVTAGRMRDDALHLVGMLRRTVDEQTAVLLRQRHRHVAFEVELVLPAQRYAALQAANSA